MIIFLLTISLFLPLQAMEMLDSYAVKCADDVVKVGDTTNTKELGSFYTVIKAYADTVVHAESKQNLSVVTPKKNAEKVYTCCGKLFAEQGLKIHKGKMHKKNNISPKKLLNYRRTIKSENGYFSLFDLKD